MPLQRRRTSLRGAVVLLTGASEGIGAACARELRERGARLSLTGRSEEKLARIAEADELVTAADLTGDDTPGLLVGRTLDRFGRIDVVINNAGRGIYWPVAETPLSESKALFELNFFAPMRLLQAVIPHMKERRSGSIVNVGSIAGRVVLPWMPVYSASKAALGALTASLRMELAGDGIHVMLVSPGYVLTGFHGNAGGMAPPVGVVEGKRFAISPEQCARDIARGIERGAREVMTPRWGWGMVAAQRIAPRLLENRLMALNSAGERA